MVQPYVKSKLLMSREQVICNALTSDTLCAHSDIVDVLLKTKTTNCRTTITVYSLYQQNYMQLNIQ